MIIRFWGVRGSIAVPGPSTLRYGGNTACVSVEAGTRMIVLDAGTGIRALGHALSGKRTETFVLLSHPHADHVCGFPFFAPLYQNGGCVVLFDYEHGGMHWSLLEMLEGFQSPVRPIQAAAACRKPLATGLNELRSHGFEVRTIPLNHPGGALGFRIEYGGHSFVYMTDNEVDASEPSTSFDEFVEFCAGADVLCHDAQYLAHELPARLGWGHSTVDRACDLAEAARVRKLVLFHHDPTRTDDVIDEIVTGAAGRLLSSGIECVGASEGNSIELEAQATIY